MELKLAQKIVKIAEDSGEAEVSLYLDYVGRNFFNTRPKTVGVVGLSPLQILKLVIQNADLFVDDDNVPIFEEISKLSVDDLGKGQIVY